MIFFKSVDRSSRGASRVKGINPNDGTSFSFTIQRSLDSPFRLRADVALLGKIVSEYCHFDAIAFAQALQVEENNDVLGGWIEEALGEVDNISGYDYIPDAD